MNQLAVQIAVVSLGVLVLLLATTATVLALKKRNRRRLAENLEERVLEAEKQRLNAIMTYFQRTQLENSYNASPRFLQQPMWTFQPTSERAAVCPHGFVAPPEEISTHPGFQAAFIGTCPQCYPQYTLAQNDMLTFQYAQTPSEKRKLNDTYERTKSSSAPIATPTLPPQPPLPPIGGKVRPARNPSEMPPGMI